MTRAARDYIGSGSTGPGYGSRSVFFVVIFAGRLLHGVDHVAKHIVQPDQHGQRPVRNGAPFEPGRRFPNDERDLRLICNSLASREGDGVAIQAHGPILWLARERAA